MSQEGGIRNSFCYRIFPTGFKERPDMAASHLGGAISGYYTTHDNDFTLACSLCN